ncbi:MAG: FGGY family carbohydrate kinase [Acidimicrobiales bacterium]
MSLVAAVDAGTASVRAGLFTESGQLVAQSRRRVGVEHPTADAVEQDAEEIFEAAVDLLAECAALAGVNPSRVRHVGITNQRASVVAWDVASGRALAPVIGWQDTRTADRVDELRAVGIPMTTAASCTKIEWLNRNDAACAEAARARVLRFGTVDSWLGWKLSGGAFHVTDPSNAGSTGLYSAQAGGWNQRSLSLFGIDHRTLGDVVASDEMMHTSARSPLGHPVALSARCGDQVASAFAHDLTPGRAKLTLGTSAMVDPARGADSSPAPSGAYVLPLWRLSRPVADAPPGEQFVLEGSVHAAGATVEWLTSVGLLDSVELLDESVRRGRAGVDVVPAFAGLGTPHNDPDARAVISGLALSSTRDDIVRGAVLGIARRVSEVFATMGVAGEIVVDGGLSRSDELLQAIADLSGVALRRSAEPETTLHGIARMASPQRDGGWSLTYDQHTFVPVS